MKTQLRALIFDVDGTLADTEEFHRRAFNAAFAAHGLEWWWNRETYRDLLRVTGGKQRIAAYAEREDAQLAAHADFAALVRTLHADKTRRYDALLREQPLTLRPGIGRLFDEARANGVLLALATTTTAANLDALLAPSLGVHWRERFAAQVCGDDVAHLKPAADAYLEVLRRLQLDAREALAFEDSTNGIVSAQAAGIGVIVTPTWYSLADALPAGIVTLPHLGDPDDMLPIGVPGSPLVDLARLRQWHAGYVAVSSPGSTASCC